MRRMRRRGRRFLEDKGGDPLTGVANLFDVAMVFAVALMLALVTYYNLPELLIHDSTSITILKNPGTPDMEIITKQGTKIETLKATEKLAGGQGKKLGTAYQLETGEIIYVPSNSSEKAR